MDYELNLVETRTGSPPPYDFERGLRRDKAFQHGMDIGLGRRVITSP